MPIDGALNLMIISPAAILDIQGAIIRNLDGREIERPEGIGLDLRLAFLFRLDAETGYLSVDHRKTPNSVEVACEDGAFILTPRVPYLAQTVEEFSLPEGLAAQFYPRSTLFRSGVIFQSSALPPGYEGRMTFSLVNMHQKPFEIQRLARFAHVVFMQVDGKTNPYKGQWKNSRVSANESEQQL